MPWGLKKRGSQWCVVKKTTGKPIKGGCHPTREKAVNHLVAIRKNADE